MTLYKVNQVGSCSLGSHAVVLQDGGALALKVITKHPFFFKMVSLIVFVIYFLIKVEITLLNYANLTDCFTSTLRQHLHCRS